jgi:hypothetical protein
MAPRKRPETNPVIDDPNYEDLNNTLKELPKAQMRALVHLIYASPADRVRQLHSAAATTMKRVGMRRAKGTVAKKPRGAAPSNSDFQSVFVWMDKLEKGDKAAMDQVLAIHATCAARL